MQRVHETPASGHEPAGVSFQKEPLGCAPKFRTARFVCFSPVNIATAKAMHYPLRMKHSPLVSAILLLLCFSAHAQTALPDDGQVKNGVYVNFFFSLGFRYPKDWVVPEEAINERIRKRAKEEAAKSGTF
jgi:hypothetical protein